MCRWNTCLVGSVSRKGDDNNTCEYADHVVASVHELQYVWPHLFEPKSS